MNLLIGSIVCGIDSLNNEYCFDILDASVISMNVIDLIIIKKIILEEQNKKNSFTRKHIIAYEYKGKEVSIIRINSLIIESMFKPIGGKYFYEGRSPSDKKEFVIINNIVLEKKRDDILDLDIIEIPANEFIDIMENNQDVKKCIPDCLIDFIYKINNHCII